jgi:hypothetical protein
MSAPAIAPELTSSAIEIGSGALNRRSIGCSQK